VSTRFDGFNLSLGGNYGKSGDETYSLHSSYQGERM